MVLAEKVALLKYSDQLNRSCRIEHGERPSDGRKLTFLISTPNKDEELEVFYALKDNYELSKPICGTINNFESKQLNSRCLSRAGRGTDHPGVGKCVAHINRKERIDKDKRSYFSKQIGLDPKSVFFSLVRAIELEPLNELNELENLYAIAKTTLFSKIKRKSEAFIADDNWEDEEPSEAVDGMGLSDKVTDDVIISYYKLCESFLKDIAVLRQISMYSPKEISKWLDEVMFSLDQRMGKRKAQEIINIISTSDGLLNKSNTNGVDVNGNIGVLSFDDSMKAFPLGYPQKNPEDADFTVIEDENGEDETDKD